MPNMAQSDNQQEASPQKDTIARGLRLVSIWFFVAWLPALMLLTQFHPVGLLGETIAQLVMIIGFGGPAIGSIIPLMYWCSIRNPDNNDLTHGVSVGFKAIASFLALTIILAISVMASFQIFYYISYKL